MTSVLLCAERFNLGDSSRWRESTIWRRYDEITREGTPDEIRRWLDFSWRCSCYKRRCGDTARKLEALGIRRGTACLNMLPPADCGEWDEVAACRVASTMKLWLYDTRRYERLVMFGKRVAEALVGPCELLGMYNVGPAAVPAIVVPHPSGLNRWWNDRENWERAREAMEDFL